MNSVIRGIFVAALVGLPAVAKTIDAGTQDTKAAQAAPAEAKGHTTLIGCLSGPDASGKFTLRSMRYRSGVEVFGADDLQKGSGEKVKLTGLWKSSDTLAAKGNESRKFQASEVEILSENCQAPTETTPVSKQKQQKQQQKSNATDATSPK